MSINELRNHAEYAICMKKIKSYPKGFKFTIPYNRMTTGQANAMRIVMRDAVNMGLIESVAIGLSLSLEQTDETFIKVGEVIA